MASLLALLGGKLAIGTIFGGGAFASVGAFFAGRFAKPLLILGTLLIVVALTLTAVAVHQHRVAVFGAERYAAGQAERQAAWDKAVAAAKIERAAELRRASEDLSMRDLQQMQAEEADDARNERINADLARQLIEARAGAGICTVPGELLAPRRSLNPRSH